MRWNPSRTATSNSSCTRWLRQQNARAPRPDDAQNAARDQAMEDVATRSMRVYRELIDDPEFWPWYQRVTPIEHISRLPIASRPSSRSPSGPTFDSLRAIPWNFAWTQTRYNTPGWYGMGTGLAEAIAAKEITLDKLRSEERRVGKECRSRWSPDH